METVQLIDKFDRELPLFGLQYRRVRAYIYFTTKAGHPNWRLQMWDNKGNETEQNFTTFGYAVLAAKEWIQNYYDDAQVKLVLTDAE